MVTSNNSDLPFTLTTAIARYATAIAPLEQPKIELSPEQLLEILIARDTVETKLPERDQATAETIIKLLKLDETLNHQAKVVSKVGHWQDWRKTLSPPESAWWWFLDTFDEVHPWDRFDWIWNSLTMGCLISVVAAMMHLIPRFLVGGQTLLESFGLLGPSGLVALAFSSLQGGLGKELLQKGLKKLGIPSHLESEVTFGISALLLGGALFTYHNLPRIADHYHQEGQDYYEQGLLRKAEANYLQAISLNPEKTEYNLSLGEVYESLNELDQATEQYRKAVADGQPGAFNHLGRVYLQKQEPVIAETLFRIGLKNTQDPTLEFQLHRNLGWSLFNQTKYDQAIPVLETAIKYEQQTLEIEMGSGMAACLLAKTLELKKRPGKATPYWNLCRVARPETIPEYKWFMEAEKRDIVNQVDITGIVAPDEDTP